MTDELTMTGWGSDLSTSTPWLDKMGQDISDRLSAAGARLRAATPDALLTRSDLDDVYRLAAQARAVRPEGDRFVMNDATLDLVNQVVTVPALIRLTCIPYGIPIHIDEGMPDGVIEFRDGDRVVKRIEHGTPTIACCDLHGRNCEQGGDECCYGCTEAHHFEVGHGGVACSWAWPDLSADGS